MHRFLTAGEVARMLGMSPDKAERFIHRYGLQSRLVSGVPTYLLRDVMRMVEGVVGSSAADRLRSLDRAFSRDSGLNPKDPFASRALRDGGVFASVPANTKPSLLRHLTKLACETEAVFDGSTLLRLLEDRESSASTAIFEGVAFPHPQGISGLWLQRDLLLLARTSRPLPFGGPSGRMTSLFFLLLFTDPVSHVHMLARLAGMLRKGNLADRLAEADSAETMQMMIETAELEYITS